MEKLTEQLEQAEVFAQEKSYSAVWNILNNVLQDLPGDSQISSTAKSRLFKEVSRIYLMSGRPEDAVLNAEHALHWAMQSGDPVQQILSYKSLGLALLDKAEYQRAIDNLFEALSLDKDNGISDEKASILEWIGRTYAVQNQLTKAVEYYHKALDVYEQLGNKSKTVYILGHLGTIYGRLSNYVLSLEYLNKALKLSDEIGDVDSQARNLGNIGIVYSKLNNLTKAEEYHLKALQINESRNNLESKESNWVNLGNVYAAQGDYHKAISFFERSRKQCEERGNMEDVAANLGRMGTMYIQLDDLNKAKELQARAEEINRRLGNNKLLLHSLFDQADLMRLQTPPDYTGSEAKLKEMVAISQEQKLIREESEAYHLLAEIYRAQERWKEADEHFQKYHHLSEDIFSIEAKKQANLYAMEREAIEREKAEAVKLAAIKAKQEATESLLYKVMPNQIARRMLNGDEQIADYHPSTSILFADLQGFTAMTSELPPFMLLQMLHNVFSKFDAIVKKHQCTKIKTIGDGYLVVSGAPEACEDHAERLVKVAFDLVQPIEIPETFEAFLPEHVSLKVRVGIHTGPIIAGVVGQEVFGYDVYSDAVNIASRMESTGEPGRVHVSAEFMRHLLSRFAMTPQIPHGITFEKRDEIEVKGKGRMKTFFLTPA